MFSTRLENFLAFSSNLKLSSANSFSFSDNRNLDDWSFSIALIIFLFDTLQNGEPHDSYLQPVEEEEEQDEISLIKRVQINEMDDSGRVSDVADGKRSVNSSRVPTQAVRAMLVRTPANKDGSDATPRAPDENRTEQREPDILITEVKDQLPQLVEGDDDDGSDIEADYKHVNIETVDAGSAEEDWDTDLELEGKIFLYMILNQLKQ